MDTNGARGNAQKAKPQGLRERKKARQKKQILSAAIELFREQGYDETRVADIVEACEISQPTFFRYFPSKDAIVEEIAGGLMGVLGENDGISADESIEGAVKRRYRVFTRAVIENRELAQATCSGLRLRRSGTGRSVGSPVLWAMKRGQETGEISPNVPADVLADLLSSMLGGVILQWATGGGEEDLQSRVDLGIELFFKGAHP